MTRLFTCKVINVITAQPDNRFLNLISGFLLIRCVRLLHITNQIVLESPASVTRRTCEGSVVFACVVETVSAWILVGDERCEATPSLLFLSHTHALRTLQKWQNWLCCAQFKVTNKTTTPGSPDVPRNLKNYIKTTT